MAVVSTSITPMAFRFPLISPLPSPEQWWSNNPMAEIVFTSKDEDITLSGVGDSQAVSWICNLPPGYGYTFEELNFGMYNSVDPTEVDGWSVPSFSNLVDQSPSLWITPVLVERSVATPIASNGLRVWTPTAGLPKKVVQAIGTGANFQINLQNLNTNKSALKVRAFARFFQFDLNQAYRTSVNAPVLVR